MFRHVERGRTYRHNIKLAGLLSFIAGIVNICGVLSVHTLTTNVTGHFAYFAEQLQQREYGPALNFLLYILAYFLGSFLSSLAMEASLRNGYRTVHVVPMLLEIAILLGLGFAADDMLLAGVSGIDIALLLLFAMGLQNALVTRVSKSVVRTTHLTGLFTDLGIELSQLLFYKREEQQEKLTRSVHLKLVIISSFFAGCIVGGYVYKTLTLHTLAVAAGLLAVALAYDTLKFRYYRLRRGRNRA
ncbi:YoaK family protein [Pontibacter russatus]|uniref:YoaK family protein n=1 Tax=Pontibacter russatus TaxID=2694929 RepID=UPI0013798EB3|nr:YoaK family protein [Pontibacter russatus]